MNNAIKYLGVVVLIIGVGVLGLLAYQSTKLPLSEDLLISNQTDTSVTLVFRTNTSAMPSVSLLGAESERGEVKFYDDRNVVEDTDGNRVLEKRYKYRTHHITLTGLKPESEYNIRIDGVKQEEGQEVTSISTLATSDELNVPDPIYGKVEGGSSNTIVMVTVVDENEEEITKVLTTPLAQNNSYSFDVANARDFEGNVIERSEISGEKIRFYGNDDFQHVAPANQDQPVETLTTTEEGNSGGLFELLFTSDEIAAGNDCTDKKYGLSVKVSGNDVCSVRDATCITGPDKFDGGFGCDCNGDGVATLFGETPLGTYDEVISSVIKCSDTDPNSPLPEGNFDTDGPSSQGIGNDTGVDEVNAVLNNTVVATPTSSVNPNLPDANFDLDDPGSQGIADQDGITEVSTFIDGSGDVNSDLKYPSQSIIGDCLDLVNRNQCINNGGCADGKVEPNGIVLCADGTEYSAINGPDGLKLDTTKAESTINPGTEPGAYAVSAYFSEPDYFNGSEFEAEWCYQGNGINVEGNKALCCLDQGPGSVSNEWKRTYCGEITTSAYFNFDNFLCDSLGYGNLDDNFLNGYVKCTGGEIQLYEVTDDGKVVSLVDEYKQIANTRAQQVEKDSEFKSCLESKGYISKERGLTECSIEVYGDPNESLAQEADTEVYGDPNEFLAQEAATMEKFDYEFSNSAVTPIDFNSGSQAVEVGINSTAALDKCEREARDEDEKRDCIESYYRGDFSFNLLESLFNLFGNKASAQSQGTGPGLYSLEVQGFTVTTQNVKIVDFDDNGNPLVVFFQDTNQNGLRDLDEPIITDIEPTQISIEKQANGEEFRVEEGWNLVGLPILPQVAEERRASGYLQAMNEQGVVATQIATFRDGKWRLLTFRRDTNEALGDDFEMIPGEGYFIRSYSTSSYVVVGNPYTESIGVDLIGGWNLINVVSPGTNYDSVGLMDAISDGGVAANLVSNYSNGAYQNNVKQDGVTYGTKFEINDKKGYFVRVEEGSKGTFTP